MTSGPKHTDSQERSGYLWGPNNDDQGETLYPWQKTDLSGPKKASREVEKWIAEQVIPKAGKYKEISISGDFPHGPLEGMTAYLFLCCPSVGWRWC